MEILHPTVESVGRVNRDTRPRCYPGRGQRYLAKHGRDCCNKGREKKRSRRNINRTRKKEKKFIYIYIQSFDNVISRWKRKIFFLAWPIRTRKRFYSVYEETRLTESIGCSLWVRGSWGNGLSIDLHEKVDIVERDVWLITLSMGRRKYGDEIIIVRYKIVNFYWSLVIRLRKYNFANLRVKRNIRISVYKKCLKLKRRSSFKLYIIEGWTGIKIKARQRQRERERERKWRDEDRTVSLHFLHDSDTLAWEMGTKNF